MDRTDLPPPLMVSEPGSFAEYTIAQRKPQIIRDVLARNPYPPAVMAGLRALERELAESLVAPLTEHTPDVAFWQQQWQPWEGKTWHELPWFFAETYFYRRLLEVVRYFQPGPWHLVDPFAAQKHEELARAMGTLATFYDSFPQGAPAGEQFAIWLQRSLWGNRADLSNVVTMAQAHRHLAGQESEKLLIDDTERAWALFQAGKARCLALVTDNSGLELLADLGLVDWLLAHNCVDRVHLHLKSQPYFVSDAMTKDLRATLEALSVASHPALHALGSRLTDAHETGRLLWQDHPFWATCLAFHAFPDDLRSALARADLLVFKGDVNYRRLLDDRHWPPATDLATITRHMPASFLVLRTLKGELIVGLQPGQAESLAQIDPNWLLNGERGIIQLVTL